MNLFASLVIWSLSKPKKDRTFQPDTVIMMSSNCELTGEPAENAKDIVFVTITGPAKWLAGPSLLKSDVASGATFHTLLRNELTTLQTVHYCCCYYIMSCCLCSNTKMLAESLCLSILQLCSVWRVALVNTSCLGHFWLIHVMLCWSMW